MTYIQSNIGGRTENQDFYGSAQTKFGELVIVCDGMGGHNGGMYAAERTVQIVIEEVTKSDDTNPSKALQKAICCHVGDSRIYQLRKGEVIYRTSDHSQVFDLVRQGKITEEQARLSDKSNVITRSLGTKLALNVEMIDNLSYKTSDRFFLCTDGIWSMIPENQLIEMISEEDNVESVVSNLMETINGIGIAYGGNHDNLTAAMLEMETSPK
jgi:serine/threonine protein phosphatase PrpC